MSYTVTWEPHGLYVEFLGTVAPADVASLYEATLSDLRFDDMRYVIGDFLGVTGHGFTVGDMAAMRDLNAPVIGAAFSNPYMVVAIVVANPALRAVAHDFARLGLYPVELFETLAAARDWARGQNPTGTFRRLEPH